ncbi:MAG: class I SAM-dependent methyltransferase [Maritimibacter sp.]|nr:class I SAM-dependent methyltransferase [Maritimibacter sp.]
MTQPLCRHCAHPLTDTVFDLGFAPPSNAYLEPADLARPEHTFPLTIHVCPSCFLVQTADFTSRELLFDKDYAYFSSTSQGWLKHAADYASMIIERLDLSAESFVIEVASNDGYLLRNFVAAGIPCLGIEPTKSTAQAAAALGIPVRQEFFGRGLGEDLAARGQRADLIAGNNVFAHVPDINDFTEGLAAALKPEGVITLEFPHLLRLVEHCLFDTVYHEHFSYLSLGTVVRIMHRAGLRVFDVEELPTHGGSLRVYACHAGSAHAETPRVAAVLDAERAAGLEHTATYAGLQSRAVAIKHALLRFLLDAAASGKSVAGYGAAAKGNTLLNFAGVRPDLLPRVADAAPSKQGKLLPGSHIPIVAPEALRAERPDYVIILPWNIAAEVRDQLADLAAAGTRFVTCLPELVIH